MPIQVKLVCVTMDIPAFVPVNDLEVALLQLMRGEVDVSDFVRVLMEENVAIPSITEVLANGSGMSPLIFDKQGVGMV